MSSSTIAPSSCNANPLAMQIEHLYWPPKHLLPPNVTENERVDLLSFLDSEVYNCRGSYPMKLPYGITVLRDRVVLEQERFHSPSRDHQQALANQFQASFSEQGFSVVVKEWANPTQKRSILRVRLKCRFAGCKFHFQINWDSNMQYWFISRRRCGIFQHSCRTMEQPNPPEALVHHQHHSHNKRPVAESPPTVFAGTAKRARMEHAPQDIERPPVGHHHDQPFLVTPQVNGSQAMSLRTVSCEQSPSGPAGSERKTAGGTKEGSAMDFAESLLSLSKGKSSHEDEESTPSEDQKSSPSSQLGSKTEETERETYHQHPSAAEAHHYSMNLRPTSCSRSILLGDIKTEDSESETYHPSAAEAHHHSISLRSTGPSRPIVLGEIPHGTQAFNQMAQTMGQTMFTHLIHGRGEMNLTMSYDGEGFVLKTCIPAPESYIKTGGPLSYPPLQQQHHQGPLPPQHHVHPRHFDPNARAQHSYPFLPPRSFRAPPSSHHGIPPPPQPQAPRENPTTVVML